MKIFLTTKLHQKNTNFKQGLTSYEINAVRNMKSNAYESIAEKLKSLYGMDTQFKQNNTVAWCVDQVAEIMNRAGFTLPKAFRFAPIQPDALGTYDIDADEVVINACHDDFNSLESMNRLEEGQNDYHPETRHFLQTYLHEFSHAAHYNNLREIHGSYKAYDLFTGILGEYSPKDIIVGPLNYILKDVTPKFAGKIIDKLFPVSNGTYAKKNLKEYFAEKNSKKLAQQLGKSYIVSNIEPEFKNSYQNHPRHWQLGRLLREEFSKQITRNLFDDFLSFGEKVLCTTTGTINGINNGIKLCEKDIAYTDGDIFNGNEKKIMQNAFLYSNQR